MTIELMYNILVILMAGRMPLKGLINCIFFQGIFYGKERGSEFVAFLEQAIELAPNA